MKNGIKFKNFFDAVILSFVLSFMLFVYEPIVTYSASFNDYWFTFKTLLTNNLVFFLILFTILSGISLIIWFISYKSKKKLIWYIYLIAFFVGFVATYIHGNYLAGALPTLDGAPIDWSLYTKMSIISIMVFVVLIVVNIILYKKFNNIYSNVVKYTTLAIFAMLSVSLVSILCTEKEMYAEKGIYGITMNNINSVSTNKNFLMLLVDMEDSKTFDAVLKDMQKEEIFKDFTYYPDTLSAYPFTRESIPYVLSGQWYEAETTFSEYYDSAMSNSKFIDTLQKKDYQINIYEEELIWNDNDIEKLENAKQVNYKIDTYKYLREEAKYILFKYLPYPLKRFSKIETMDLTETKTSELDSEIFDAGNKFIYDSLNVKTTQKQNYFQFLHIDGGHYPWDVNADFEPIENGTYEEKIASSIKVIEKWLSRIKESGQYDNSVIIVLADHGNNGYDPVGRQNPILYIKGLNETHKEMVVSDKKVSYTDLNDTIYYDLLDGKKSTELLANIESNRKRRFIWYKDYDKMYEQTLIGHAWETEKLKNTGVKYER